MTNAERAALRREVGQLVDRYQQACRDLGVACSTYREAEEICESVNRLRGALDAALDRLAGS